VRHFHESDTPATPAILAGIAHVETTLRRLGARSIDITLPPLVEFNAVGWIVLMAEAFAIHRRWLPERFRDYGEYLRDRLSLAALVSAADYLEAQRRRRELCATVAAAMTRCDLLLTAAQATEAPPIDRVGKWSAFETPGFTMPFNLTGQPALALCCGFGEHGLPVAAQLVGRLWEDATVLRAGVAYEQASGWRQRRPAQSW
jgi:aspartyl-tRNA(Asn)/glutamyl-tRNA(Gln) amidotransferase subunit A